MKTLREYIEILDEISRRDFLKGMGAGAIAGVAGDRFLNQKPKNIQLPNDPTAYFLLGNFQGFSYLGPYNKTIEKWHSAMAPYIDEVTLKKRTGQEDALTQSYDRGFAETRNSVKINRQSGMSDQDTADWFARHWVNSYNKLVAKLNQNNESISEEELDEAGTPDAVARILELSKNK